MKLRTLAVLGIGYVLGTRAGRERYDQIVATAQQAPKRLEDYSSKLDSFSGRVDGFRERVDVLRTKLQDYSAQ